MVELNPHWSFLILHAAALVASMVLGIVAVISWDGWPRYVAGVLVLIALGFFIPRYLRWRSTNFLVTSERCIYQAGVVAKSSIEIPLERINTVFFRQSFFERLMGAGDLAIESGGEMGRQEFSDIRKPADVQHAIYTQKERNENALHDRIGRAAQATAVAAMADRKEADAAPSIPQQIQQLAELRDSGVLSDEEFEVKKQDLLDRM